MTRAGGALLLTVLCAAGCEDCLRPPAFLDGDQVSREEACARVEAALRAECEGQTFEFNCDAFYGRPGRDCSGPQRESDVELCERRIERARDCDEALDTICSVACEPAPLIPPVFDRSDDG